jgi:hypothetical protein
MQNRKDVFDVLKALEKHVYDDPQVYWVMCDALNTKIMDHILELSAIGDAPETVKEWIRERIRVVDHRRYVALDYANQRLDQANGGSLA